MSDYTFSRASSRSSHHSDLPSASNQKHRAFIPNSPSTISSFQEKEDNFIMSTRQDIQDGVSPHFRPAQRQSYYNPISSSPGHQSFKSFDNDDINSESSGVPTIEVARGHPQARGTPGRQNNSYMASDVILASSPMQTRPSLQSRTKQARHSTGADRADLKKIAPAKRVSSLRPAPEQRASFPSAQNTQTDDGSDFALPEFEGISKLIDPLADQKTQPSRLQSRLNPARRTSSGNDQFLPIKSVAVPVDNKQQFDMLSFLQKEMMRLQNEVKRLSKSNQEYKIQVEDLQGELEAEHTARQADSAFGSEDEAKESATKTQVENARLQAKVRSLEREIQKIKDYGDDSIKLAERLKKERNFLITQSNPQSKTSRDPSVAKLQTDNGHLRKENEDLRVRVDELQQLIEEYEQQLNNTRDRHDDAEEEWAQRESDFTQKLAEGDTAIIAENRTLHGELLALRSKYDQDLQRLKSEAEKRREAFARAQQEFAKLESENMTLRKELQSARDKVERDQRDLLVKDARTPESQQQVNEELRQNNEQLRAELARLKSGPKASEGSRPDRAESSRAINSRSKSPSRQQTTAPARSKRYSTPMPHANDDDGSDSTTELFSERKPLNLGKMPASRNNRNPSSRVEQVARAEPDTYLTQFSPEDIINIRRSIEEEYASRKARAISAEPNKPSLARKSSLRNNSKTRMSTGALSDDNLSVHSVHSRISRRSSDDKDATTGQPDTRQSRRSSLSARRRTPGPDAADDGMTSALIIPDITLNAKGIRPTLSASARNVLSNLAPHSPRQCTVCHRIASAQHPNSPPASPRIMTPAPISDVLGQRGDIDSTVRPSEPPLKALSRVIRQLADEIVHAKLELHIAERSLAAHNPARSKRDRDTLHEAIEGLNKIIAVKCDQIYSLYDVLEGHKGEIAHNDGEIREADEELEQDVTEDVQAILEELKAGRRVTIQSPPVAERVSAMRPMVEDIDDDDDELPWDGFSETGSLASKRR
ncbi:hypothetical protein BT63DRAFT_424401 [Microthyrium microscopicum]|uniref:Cep57 centrosome microtubule-binding domain-containing protein n=1 Tax=Microthyrium microscopicum TaxID=703497 RepID=A0A6A6UH88_9PEZI|nr:hypothetical protein BT63DRAFT_424401 [Microthyrium microscopicum]